uniref:Sec-independent protein translocase protein n=1 Tax=Cavernulicola chilensis TaxID=3028028 RepID=A0A7H0WB77_9RHOD|nr:Sec-independent protein translocase protein [Cavernulicola chilensis]QNR39806.1 Sec-independent protein translocase protein [Cavernulicola chilensis]
METPFRAYLNEVRWRALYFALAAATSFYVSFTYRNTFLVGLALPLVQDQQRLIATSVSEIFSAHIFTCVNLSVLFCFPLAAHHTYSFLSNAWRASERSEFKGFLLMNTLTFVFSLYVTHYFTIPLIWDFFSNFQVNSPGLGLKIQNEVKVHSYVTWVTTTLFISANLALLPLWILTVVRDLSSTTVLRGLRKYFFTVSMVLGTMLSTPDVITQLTITLWLIASYECSLLYAINKGV